jgi:hypothetical protein
VGHCGHDGKAAETHCSRRLTSADDSDAFLDSRADDGGGTTKRRTLLSFYAARATAPTRALSPRQLPTDHDYAVPTREYQSDQSSRLLLRCHPPAVQNRNPRRSKLTSGNVFPPTPPVDALSMPERCSPSRVRSAAPNYGAPLTAARRSGRTRIATGGSGGNTRRPTPKTKAGVSPVGRNAGRNQNTVKPGGA